MLLFLQHGSRRGGGGVECSYTRPGEQVTPQLLLKICSRTSRTWQISKGNYVFNLDSGHIEEARILGLVIR